MNDLPSNWEELETKYNRNYDPYSLDDCPDCKEIDCFPCTGCYNNDCKCSCDIKD